MLNYVKLTLFLCLFKSFSWKRVKAWRHCESSAMAAMAATATRGGGALSSAKASTAKEGSAPQTISPQKSLTFQKDFKSKLIKLKVKLIF